MYRSCLMTISLVLTCMLARGTLAALKPAEAFEAATFRSGEASLPYRLLRPEKVEPGKKYPLVLFLHGAGERGTDNKAQLLVGADAFLKSENRQKYPCFVVAPQCPNEHGWVEVNWRAKSQKGPEWPSQPLNLALELLDKLVAEFPVDSDRFYVTGLSMGAFGTWDAIARRPSFFAAAIPVCGGGDAANGPKLKDLPIWAFHGDKDSVVPAVRTTAMIEAIRKAGGSPKVTIYPGVNHDSWTATYGDPAVIKWLFEQRRKTR